MREMKHTPGPWFARLDLEPNHRGRIEINGVNPDPRLAWGGLAEVVVRMEEDIANCPDGVANARLIAAAPDLLAALVALEHEYGPKTLRMAQDAIAKATGAAV